MIKFKDDENLGKAVDKMTAMCFGYEPIQSMWDLRIAGGGHKFSQLCAFKFHSKMPNHEFPIFSIAFVAKLRSKIYRQQMSNPSQWYIFKRISPVQVDVLGPDELFVNYGFDVKKFFESDVFANTVAKFKQLIEKGLKTEVPAFIEKVKKSAGNDVTSQLKDIERFSNAIREALPLLSRHVVNTKYYKLDIGVLRDSKEDNDLDAKIEKELDEKGIYDGLDEADEPIDEASFDEYRKVKGCVSGEGLTKMVQDFAPQHSLENPVTIYDRKTGQYYNIVDCHIMRGDSGLSLEIDTAKPANI